jgi:hypothetical protein
MMRRIVAIIPMMETTMDALPILRAVFMSDDAASSAATKATMNKIHCVYCLITYEENIMRFLEYSVKHQETMKNKVVKLARNKLNGTPHRYLSLIGFGHFDIFCLVCRPIGQSI